ncbi:MAG: extracellular solute-binding protein [Firmicutes bacterium]|nr:extracellular solute-binding protein [Bacillota bacterium]
MKKLLLVSLLLVAALVMATACNRNGGDGGTTANNEPVISHTPTPPADNNAAGETEAPVATPPADGETVVLRYANWNLGTEEDNNIERRMIQAFMDAHPHIRIEIDESITGDWTEALAIAASVGNLPDVFMVNDTGMMAANGWLRDITEISNADSEFVNLPASIRNATQINNVVYTVPFAQFMLGYFVNRTLFEELNLDPPEFGISVDDFVRLVRQTTDLNRPTIGLNYSNQILYWLPGARNPNLGFFAYDGVAYALNSPEMLEAVSLATELAATGMTYGGLDYDQRAVFAMPWAGGAFNHGQVAFLWDGSWVIDWVPRYAAEAGFELDFIGVPGGRTVITLDILGIASTTRHPEEAYLFARWMGHGVEGYLRRIELAREAGININSLPASSDPRVLEAFMDIVTIPGLRTAIDNMDNALIDGNKILPGHVQGRFYAQTGISIPNTDYDNATVNQVIHHSIVGNINFADHADAVNAASRAAMQAARDAIGN